jgi:hypothetical protein
VAKFPKYWVHIPVRTMHLYLCAPVGAYVADASWTDTMTNDFNAVRQEVVVGVAAGSCEGFDC